VHRPAGGTYDSTAHTLCGCVGKNILIVVALARTHGLLGTLFEGGSCRTLGTHSRSAFGAANHGPPQHAPPGRTHRTLGKQPADTGTGYRAHRHTR
jgi:hypothetical protein